MSLIWDQDLHHARDRIGVGTTVLDLGASCGDFAIPARVAGANVLAVEPYWPNTLNLREAGIPVLHAAVGAFDGCCQIHVPSDPVEQPTGCFAEYVPGPCPMLSLRSILDVFPGAEVDVVKCDIEGGEYHTFAGAREPTIRRIRFAAIEFHVWTVDGQKRREGIGHRAGAPMLGSPRSLRLRLDRTHDVTMDGNYEAGGTFFCTRRD